MDFITNPVYVLSVLCFMVILSVYAGKTKIGKQLGGAALLVILFTAVIANFIELRLLTPALSRVTNSVIVSFRIVACNSTSGRRGCRSVQ